MKDSELLLAAQSAVIFYTLSVSRDGLSPQKKEELKTTFLRNQGFKMISGHDLFRHSDGREMVKEQALLVAYGEAVKPIADQIVKGMRHKEKVLLGLLPAEGS